MTEDALAGDRLIGMIQPSEPERADQLPPLYPWAAPAGSPASARPTTVGT